MKAVFTGLCLAAAFTLPAAAADKVCNGQVAIVRVSTLKAAGTRAGFDQAVADQIAWYRGHGLTDNRIVAADVIDLSSGKPAISATEIVTFHYDPPAATGRQPEPDDGYKAFVKEFRDNSDIATEKTVCLPK
ncbi:MAG: hypothetical protein JWP16_2351 [Alphaproteobacteria bacterium]|nr:hypothetical protein [Alphaproteobacteria bacterium]MDB5741311.1 hypothetical protein [Alphaproteobacteria bacterium]